MEIQETWLDETARWGSQHLTILSVDWIRAAEEEVCWCMCPKAVIVKGEEISIMPQKLSGLSYTAEETCHSALNIVVSIS